VTEVEKTQMVVKSGDNYSYNKKLQPLAKELRKGLTKSEACLWKYALKAKQLKGYQSPKTTADFAVHCGFFL
jgi:very-short-patch-repair endonuclease